MNHAIRKTCAVYTHVRDARNTHRDMLVSCRRESHRAWKPLAWEAGRDEASARVHPQPHERGPAPIFQTARVFPTPTRAAISQGAPSPLA